MTKEVKDAVMRCLMYNIDQENYGMFATRKYSWEDAHILKRNGVSISDSAVLVNDEIVYLIKRKYSSRKVDGMYKQLKPRLIPVNPA